MSYRKYKAKKIVIDGITFDSKAEARRYTELKLLERAGEIKHLKLQPRYLLQESYKKKGKTIRKIEYVADFEYVDIRGKKIVIEDVKGVRTPVYKLKKKIFEYKYPNYEITEIYMEESFKRLKECEAVLLLGDWDLSPGAMREIYFAHQNGIRITENLEKIDE